MIVWSCAGMEILTNISYNALRMTISRHDTACHQSDQWALDGQTNGALQEPERIQVQGKQNIAKGLFLPRIWKQGMLAKAAEPISKHWIESTLSSVDPLHIHLIRCLALLQDAGESLVQCQPPHVSRITNSCHLPD